MARWEIHGSEVKEAWQSAMLVSPTHSPAAWDV